MNADIEAITPNDLRYISWLTCDCDVLTKYCDENHRASARIPVSVLEQYTFHRRHQPEDES